MAQVAPPVPEGIGLDPVTSSTASDNALKPADSVEEGAPDRLRWISDTVMVAPDLSECSLASSSAASTTSSME